MPSYTPNVPAPREVAYMPTAQNGYHPSLFPSIGTYSTGAGPLVPAPSQKQQQKESLFPGAVTYTGAPQQPSKAVTPSEPSPSIDNLPPRGNPPAEDIPLQTRGIPLAEPYPPTGLESTLNGILPSPQAMMSPMVYERPNIYGNPGITRFDDASGVPTFTNTGRAGYDQLQRGGGATFLPPGGVAELFGETGSREALGRARQAAAARGDHEAVARSYRTPEENMAYDHQKRLASMEKGILNAFETRGLPAQYLPQLLTAMQVTDAKSGLYAAQAGMYGARTQEALAKAQKAQAEAQGIDPKAGYYRDRGSKERALAESAMLDNQAKQQLQLIEQQLQRPDLTPEVRQQLMEMALAIHHGKVPNQEQFRTIALSGGKDEFGNPLPAQPYTYSQTTGEPTQGALPGAQPTQAPAAAIEHLKKNPQLKEQFKAKYGYLPPGV